MERRVWITWWIIFFIKYSRLEHATVTDNASKMIELKSIENRITFKTKTGHYLELVMTETIKLLGSTKSKITKDKNSKMCLI